MFCVLFCVFLSMVCGITVSSQSYGVWARQTNGACVSSTSSQELALGGDWVRPAPHNPPHEPSLVWWSFAFLFLIYFNLFFLYKSFLLFCTTEFFLVFFIIFFFFVIFLFNIYFSRNFFFFNSPPPPPLFSILLSFYS